MDVLLGFDGSTLADRAIREAVVLAGESGTVTVAVYGIDEGSREDVEATIREEFESADVEVAFRRVDESPGGQLVELAEAEGFDRIILPGGSRSPLGKIQLDGVAEFVLLNAQTSVTLAR